MATKNSCPFPALHLAVLALLLVIPTPADAQPPSGPSFSDGPYGGGYTVRINPAIAAIIIAFICGFFFLGFFSVYLRQCGSRGSGTRPSGAVESGAAASRASRRGLDPELLASFPTMKYADAKKHNKGKGALECAVCLCEFDDDDSLRLLPSCCHVFHVDCVDVWLDTHVTCPVCRANLAETAVAGAAAAVSCESMTAEDAGTAEERDLEAGQPPVQYRRWHSTGHEGAQVDRHTLRLPEHVMREIVTAAGLRRAASVVEPRLRGEASGRRGYRGGRSGRWGFLLRTFSVRRRADGAAAEGSSKRIFPTTDVPLSFGGGVGGEISGSAREETRGVVGVKSESAREAEKGVKPEFGKEAEADAESSSANVAASTRQ